MWWWYVVVLWCCGDVIVVVAVKEVKTGRSGDNVVGLRQHGDSMLGLLNGDRTILNAQEGRRPYMRWGCFGPIDLAINRVFDSLGSTTFNSKGQPHSTPGATFNSRGHVQLQGQPFTPGSAIQLRGQRQVLTGLKVGRSPSSKRRMQGVLCRDAVPLLQPPQGGCGR